MYTGDKQIWYNEISLDQKENLVQKRIKLFYFVLHLGFFIALMEKRIFSILPL
jgi:hypothetical protein